jgi:hypothetical protein
VVLVFTKFRTLNYISLCAKYVDLNVAHWANRWKFDLTALLVGVAVLMRESNGRTAGFPQVSPKHLRYDDKTSRFRPDKGAILIN